jgi:predicted transcriptional regulator
MSRSQLRGAFSDLEQSIMEVVWKRGKATADEVRHDLAPARVLKESTIRTMLSRLEEKGHLRHTVAGRTFIYSAVEAPQNLAIRAVRQIVEKFCAGSVEQLLVGMVSNDLIDAADLRQLADKVSTGKVAKTKTTRRGEAK